MSACTPQPTSALVLVWEHCSALIQEPLWGIRIYYISKSSADNQKMCVYNLYIVPSLDINRR